MIARSVVLVLLTGQRSACQQSSTVAPEALLCNNNRACIGTKIQSPLSGNQAPSLRVYST